MKIPFLKYVESLIPLFELKIIQIYFRTAPILTMQKKHNLTLAKTFKLPNKEYVRTCKVQISFPSFQVSFFIPKSVELDTEKAQYKTHPAFLYSFFFFNSACHTLE